MRILEVMHMIKKTETADTPGDNDCACAHEEHPANAAKSGTVMITEDTLKEALLRNDEEWQKRLLLAVMIMLIIVLGQ
jgi:hypothetical protein